MKETGLMFKAPLVRAILSGQKTQTRRPVAMPRKRDSFVMLDHGKGFWPYQSDDGESELCDDGNEHPYASPFGMPGDRIYVRETTRSCRAYEVQGYPPSQWGNKPIWFEADGTPTGAETAWATKATPAIHLPKWAARLWLEIAGVRVERLQDITDADALVEGVDRTNTSIPGYARERFRQLWESTGGDWAANPWVWVIDFKAISTTGRPA